MARGNVPGAICAATASNLLGTVLTPLLVAVLLHRQGGGHGLADAGRILLQLLLPFALGSLLRPWIGAWAQRNNRVLSKVDRSSILLAVYTAFSEAVAQGIWHAFPPLDLATMVLVNAVLLGAVLLITTWARAGWACPRRTRSRWCSVARRNRWPRAFRWRPCCSARRRWHRGAAPDDLPPDAADGLRGAGAALCRPGSAGGRGRGAGGSDAAGLEPASPYGPEPGTAHQPSGGQGRPALRRRPAGGSCRRGANRPRRRVPAHPAP